MPVIVQVEGLAEFRRALKTHAPDMNKELQKTLRKAVGPIVADARARLNALPGTGPRTAKQVRSSVTNNGVAVNMVAKGGYEFGREFGSRGYKVSHYQVKTRGGREVPATRAFNYALPSVFDSWTGNRFTLDSGVSGRGLFPAAALGGARAVEQVWAAIDGVIAKMASE